MVVVMNARVTDMESLTRFLTFSSITKAMWQHFVGHAINFTKLVMLTCDFYVRAVD